MRGIDRREMCVRVRDSDCTREGVSITLQRISEQNENCEEDIVMKW